MRSWRRITMIMRNFFRRNGDKERQEKYERMKENESVVEMEPTGKELDEFKKKVRNHAMVKYPPKDFGVTYRKSSISGAKRKVRHVSLPGSDIPEGQEHYEHCQCGSPLIHENGHDLLCLGKVNIERRPSHNESIRRASLLRELPICPSDHHREAFYYRAAQSNHFLQSIDTRVARPVRAELLDGQRKRSPFFQSAETLPAKFSRVEITPTNPNGSPQFDGHAGVVQPERTCTPQCCCRYPDQ